MIHHVSIPARNPQHVAEVLAEVMGGKCMPFGPLEGAFMAMGSDRGMIEVYPERATLDIPANDDQVVFGENQAPPQTWPVHILLSVLDPLRERITRLCCHGGLTGVPQVSIPGCTVDGLPIGLSIVGGHGSDGTLVAVARALT